MPKGWRDKYSCGECGHEDKRKKLKKLKSGWLCKKCYKKKRKQHRKFLKRKVLGITKDQEQKEKKLIKKNSNKNKCKCGNLKNQQAKTCRECYKKKREKKKKKRQHEEWKKKRNSRENLPKIKGSKDTSKIRARNPYKGIWLTKLEKQILYKKYSGLGYTTEEIKKKQEQIRKHFKTMIEKWRDKKLEDEEINKKFKEEFSKLIN